MVSDNPRGAISRLDSIDVSTLSEADRHFRDLLAIKAADKAYVIHRSDSLVLDVIDWYGSHRKFGLYPEALYYGGRVYSDLGDYPTALAYFHNALDKLPDDDDYIVLRGNIVSQTGRLLNNLRLYKEAIPYLEMSLEIDDKLPDPTGKVYDLQLLGCIYMRAGNYSKAENIFKEALENSRNLPESHHAKSSMYLAAINYRTGRIDSALYYIRNIPDKVNPIARNSALSYATSIYLEAGIMDTAYLYAHELIVNDDPLNKINGYQKILYQELRGFSHPDTIEMYLDDYIGLLETFYDENENQLAINQQSFHNYQIHERERRKAEIKKNRLRLWLSGCFTIISIMACILLYLKNRNKKHIIELHHALYRINSLKKELNETKVFLKDREDLNTERAQPAIIPVKNREEEKTENVSGLRKRLQTELLDLYENSKDYPSLGKIVTPKIHSDLKNRVAKNLPLNADDAMWDEIKRAES